MLFAGAQYEGCIRPELPGRETLEGFQLGAFRIVPRHTPRPRKELRKPVFPGRGVHTDPCPDCNLRDALSRTVLAPLHDRDFKRRRAYRQGKPIQASPLVVDYCENCGGTGRVPRESHHDPYENTLTRPWWEKG